MADRAAVTADEALGWLREWAAEHSARDETEAEAQRQFTRLDMIMTTHGAPPGAWQQAPTDQPGCDLNDLIDLAGDPQAGALHQAIGRLPETLVRELLEQAVSGMAWRDTWSRG